MFSNISWQDYFIFLAVSITAYYLFIYLAYFRKAVQLSNLKRKLKDDSFNSSFYIRKEDQQSLFEVEAPEFRQPERNSEEHVVYACMDELNAFFDNQKKSKPVKSELMFALHAILEKYPSLRSSEYKESLSNVIATQCESICSVHLSAEEMKGVWFG